METSDGRNGNRSAGRASTEGSNRQERDDDQQMGSQQRKRGKNNGSDGSNSGGDANASSQFGYRGNKKRRGDDDDNFSRSRSIGLVTSSERRAGMSSMIGSTSSNDLLLRARANIDTKADTVCEGSTFELHENTRKIVHVFGFHDSLGSKDVPVGTCITAVDLANETIIAVFPQSLYFGKSMENSLLPPAQMWNHGMVVDVVPKQFSSGKSFHGIYHHDEGIIIPFSLHGCMSYIPTRLPSESEKNSCGWV